MATECSKTSKLHAVSKSKRNSYKAQKDFEGLIRKNMPGWSAVWNILLQEDQHERKIRPLELKQKIQRKILDLLDEEQILVDLYKRAAEEAKKEEEEFKSKTTSMLQQIEKDKNLMKIFKPVN